MTRNALTIRTDDGDSLPPRLPINRDSVTVNHRRPQSARALSARMWFLFLSTAPKSFITHQHGHKDTKKTIHNQATHRQHRPTPTKRTQTSQPGSPKDPSPPHGTNQTTNEPRPARHELDPTDRRPAATPLGERHPPPPRGTIRRYQAAPGVPLWRPPECPDGHGRLRRRSPAGEGG